MLTDPFFYTTIAALAALSFSLAHNITSGKKLREELLAKINELKLRYTSGGQ